MLKRIEGFLKTFDLFKGLFSAILTILLVLSVVLNFVNSTAPLAIWLRENLIWIWLFVLTIFLFTTFYKLDSLEKRLLSGITINLKGNLDHTWDFEGPSPWSTTHDHELIVTGSDAGGITKVGRFWENYDLLFKAHILYNCIGVIIRAESLSSYYMFQIHKDCIIPHRRSLIRVKESSLDVDEKGLIKNLKIAPGLYIVGWNTDDKVPLQKQIDGWFDCKITASGSSVAVYINGIIVFEDKEFLQIPTGKIGFRNDGPEKAIVKDIKVITKQSF